MSTPDQNPTFDPQVLDTEVIEGLRELGGEEDPGLLLELVEMFLDDAPNRLREMEESLSSGDLDTMRRAAHTLKSSSANMGAVLLCQICKDMEQAARDENQDSYREMAAQCLDAYADFEGALKLLS